MNTKSDKYAQCLDCGGYFHRKGIAQHQPACRKARYGYWGLLYSDPSGMLFFLLSVFVLGLAVKDAVVGFTEGTIINIIKWAFSLLIRVQAAMAAAELEGGIPVGKPTNST